MRRFIMALLAGLAVLAAPRARAELVDRVAAIVNDDVITLSEVEKRAAPELARIDQEATGPDRAQKRAAAMKRRARRARHRAKPQSQCLACARPPDAQAQRGCRAGC